MTGNPRLLWEVSGVHLLFHYTFAEHAEQIGAERLYVVSDQQSQQAGPGLFLTNLQPGALSDEALCKRLFVSQRPLAQLRGVVVLRADDRILPVKRIGPSQFIHSVARGFVLDLTALLIGYGRRNPHNGQWLFPRSCYET
jgi:hypothetical protein